MPHFDRLTALISRFRLIVSPDTPERSNLAVLDDGSGQARTVVFHPDGRGFAADASGILLSAKVDWGGPSNPLIAALPETVAINLADNPDIAGVVRLMCSEINAPRCGLGPVISRLGEVLVVHMLRAEIASGATETGLVGGLSDPRLSRAIVAIHEEPGRAWRREDLAELAGMSLSRFCELFLERVGETPSAYLRRWRLVLAQQDLRQGGRVEVIARRFGYSSPEGFARAFRRQFGENPVDYRGRAAA